MSKKAFVAPLLLSLACLLLVSDFASAQRRGGYRGGGNRGWYGWSSGYYNSPGWWGGGYYNTYPGWWGGSYGNPRYSNYYGSGYYRVYQPNEIYVPSTQNYYEPAQPDDAQIRVLLPDPQARVWFDGNLTQQTGTDRLFHTPALQAGANNIYRIRAQWTQDGREMNQERSVTVAPGRMSVVDFNQPNSEPIPNRGPNPTPSPAQPQGVELEGRIIRTGPDHFVIEGRDNRQVTIHTNPQTSYLLDRNPAAFTDIRVGNTIVTTYTTQGDRHTAVRVNIRR